MGGRGDLAGIQKGGGVEADGGKVEMASACCLDLYHVPNSGYPDIRQSSETAEDNFLSLTFAILSASYERQDPDYPISENAIDLGETWSRYFCTHRNLRSITVIIIGQGRYR